MFNRRFPGMRFYGTHVQRLSAFRFCRLAFRTQIFPWKGSGTWMFGCRAKKCAALFCMQRLANGACLRPLQIRKWANADCPDRTLLFAKGLEMAPYPSHTAAPGRRAAVWEMDAHGFCWDETICNCFPGRQHQPCPGIFRCPCPNTWPYPPFRLQC